MNLKESKPPSARHNHISQTRIDNIHPSPGRCVYVNPILWHSILHNHKYTPFLRIINPPLSVKPHLPAPLMGTSLISRIRLKSPLSQFLKWFPHIRQFFFPLPIFLNSPPASFRPAPHIPFLLHVIITASNFHLCAETARRSNSDQPHQHTPPASLSRAASGPAARAMPDRNIQSRLAI